MFSRRHFHQQLACIAGSTFASTRFVPRVFGGVGQTSPRRIVTVFLNGGNDGLNTVIPATDPLYRRYRRDLRITPQDAISLDRRMFLHPGLSKLAEIWEAGRLRIEQGVGYPNHSRSHFKSIAVWSEGRLGAQSPSFDGWLARTLDPLQQQSKSPLACAIDSVDTPELLRGRHTRTTTLPNLAPAQAGELADWFEEGDRAQPSDELQRLVAGACRDAVGVLRSGAKSTGQLQGFPSGALGQRMKQVATVIDTMPEIRAIHVAQHGYDTHSSQRNQHAALLRELAAALAALDRFLVRQGQSESTLIMVFSEFGRRVQENASAGTDHGAAGPVLFIGGAAAGGLYGKHPDLENLNRGDIVVTHDLRNLHRNIATWLVSTRQPLEFSSIFPPHRSGQSRSPGRGREVTLRWNRSWNGHSIKPDRTGRPGNRY
ncbi:MAG: DUF1501 domain-containing protein [Pirellulales bacterium]|nr:DUF1501 domain-containing protein [Pirellulales bacterium]